VCQLYSYRKNIYWQCCRYSQSSQARPRNHEVLLRSCAFFRILDYCRRFPNRRSTISFPSRRVSPTRSLYLLKLICTSDVLQVGITYHVFWNALPHKYSFITLALWDPDSDGLSVSLGHSFINFTNDGFALWTVGPDSLVGQHKFVLGVGFISCRRNVD